MSRPALRVIGLTGGIATGKSTVTSMFRDLGAHVVDADVLAREVVAPGTPGLAEIARRFPGVVSAEGSLDRAALAQRIFADANERAALNAIVHPRVREAFLERAQTLARQGAKVVLYDVPLLIENNLHSEMDGVVLVAVPEDLQLSRLMARDGLSAAQALARLRAQLPLEEKRRHATWVIDNSGDLQTTRSQVERIWESIR